MKIDIGGGTLCAPGYENVDPVHGVGAFKTFIQQGVVHLADASVEAARASHVLEHIPAGAERIAAMNEVWRLLRPGAEFETVVPVVGYTPENVPERERVGDTLGPDLVPHHNGWQPWADPTHVSHWWYPESWWYFTGGPGGAFRANADYGIRYWEWGHGHLVGGWEAHVTLVKPAGGSET